MNLNKDILKKVGIYTSVGLIASTIVVAPIISYYATGNVMSVVDQKKYVIRNNTPLSIDGYYFDKTTSYGGTQSKTDNSILNADLVKVETTGETTFELINGVQKVKTPSYQRYSFGLAKEIIFEYYEVDNAGVVGTTKKTKIFNSDVAEIKPMTSGKPTEILKSNNKDSINSNEFMEFTRKFGTESKYLVTSMNFTVQDDKYWVDSNGNKTKYKIKPEDFYYSFMRTKLFDTNYRRKNGGSKNLDSYFLKQSGTVSRFKENDAYPNEYLFGFFSVDSKKLAIQNETIKNIDVVDESGNTTTKKVFSLNPIIETKNENPTEQDIKNGAKKVEWFNLFNKTIIDSNLLTAAPSEYIEEQFASSETLNSNLPIEEIEGEDNSKDITGLARKFGIYTYGQTRQQTLFASAYTPIKASENKVIFSKNKHFSNESFVNDERSLNEIIIEYSGSINNKTFQTQQFNSFKSGLISETSYSELTGEQQLQIVGNDGNQATKNGLLFTKTLNTNKTVVRSLPATAPYNEEIDKYSFNDNFSLAMYGATRKELTDGHSISNSYFSGTALQFRNLLTSSLNWYTFTNNAHSGTKIMWINHAAQDSVINDQNPNTLLGPVNEFGEKNSSYQITNSVSYIDSKGELISITPYEMEAAFVSNAGNRDQQYKSPKFEEIKVLMGKLLDDLGFGPNDKLVWEITYPHVSTTLDSKTRQMKYLAETFFPSLDSRLAPKFVSPATREELVEKITTNNGTQKFWGWSYDYVGIGTFLDGILQSPGAGVLGAVGLFSNSNLNPQQQAIANKIPNFVSMSKALANWAEEKWSVLYAGTTISNDPKNVRVENWHKITTKDSKDYNDYFSSQVEGFQFSVELAKFFIDFQGKQGDIESSTNFFRYLIKEMNFILGTSFDTDNAIDNPNSTGLLLVQDGYEYPTPSGTFYYQDIKIREGKQ